MLYFRSCMRCKEGTVELGSDNFGSFLSCITCGYTINSRSIRSNGSIAEPATVDEEVVIAPMLEPVLVAEDVVDVETESEPDIDLIAEEVGAFDFEEVTAI
ncbi:MAG: hypothetical protein EGP07_05835 [SAR202 cluster bacterium]|jgi:hypothetical protein|nr:MAG: hypothetical protein EGP11_03370 [SAR202 cluster bacterium]MCH2530396.1 hypothetical protein [Dehalococcoidia bacterium]MQF63829.1 hypothetical protein [SAR202 cluster bacterium AD-802-L14_MRT_200m]KAA1300308.1 MAG: hypothetical protein EGP07_05835 [SAR202 cluster bacterium]KAA1306110.1 MAG: hypothetical protein EGP04_01200 [SAR202 cluster bacterium]